MHSATHPIASLDTFVSMNLISILPGIDGPFILDGVILVWVPESNHETDR